MSKTKKKDKPEAPKKAKAEKPVKKVKAATKVKAVKPAKPAKAAKPASIIETVLAAAPAIVPEVAAPVIAVVAPAKPKRKPSVAKTSAPKAALEITITLDEIGLRAYFISEKRQQTGQHGDETSDWVEAERQLRAEAAKPKRAKK